VRRGVKELLSEYGTVALVVYFAIFFAVLLGFWAAVQFGWRPASATGSVGALTAAYVATKLTQPVRIAATVALTPLVARAYERLTGRRARRSPQPAAEPARGPADVG
jgi:O-antigen ligase